MICIDSDFAIAILKGDNDVKDLLLSLEEKGDLYISSINVFELTYIIKEMSKKKERELLNLIDTLKVLPLDRSSALLASKIGRKLAKEGKMLHPMDLMIGAIALQNKMPLVTRNIKHFSRIKGLEIITW